MKIDIIAYTISALTIIITIVLLTFTLIPLFKKTIKVKTNKKTKTWFIVLIIIISLELISIGASLLGEISEYIIPAPTYGWFIFKIFSLILLWVWSYIYFFIWIKLQK